MESDVPRETAKTALRTKTLIVAVSGPLRSGGGLFLLDVLPSSTPFFALGSRAVVLRTAYPAFRLLHLVSLFSYARLSLALGSGLRGPLPALRRPTSSHPISVGTGITDKEPV